MDRTEGRIPLQMNTHTDPGQGRNLVAGVPTDFCLRLYNFLTV